jgi:hypothetical protein
MLAGLAIRGLAQTAIPAATLLSFNAAQIGVSAGSAQTLTASFTISGYAGSLTPAATLHYGHDFTLGAVSCSGGGLETCTVPVTFQPLLPGNRPDAIFLMDGTSRLATVLLSGVGQGPLSLVQPGAFSTSVPWVPQNEYLYQSVADQNGTVYILASGGLHLIISVDKKGVVMQIPTSANYYVWSISIDGAGVLYLFNESNVVETYDTVQGTPGSYPIPNPDNDTQWYPGTIGPAGTIDIVDQISNNGSIDMIGASGASTVFEVLNPGVLQPDTITADSQGNVFVGGYEINKITPSGVQTQVNTVGASEGLAVDAADTLYATRYNPTDGVAELPAADYTTPIASFGRSSPLGMSLGSDGTLYVSNYVNLDIYDRSQTETVDFGEVTAGSSKTDSSASVYNGGNQPLTISGFTLSGTGFSLDPNASNECAAGTVLAPGALCEASVVFTPGHPGAFSGMIAITSNSLNGASTAQTIQLIGTSDGSYDVLSPNPLVFTAQAPGTSKTLAVTMTNDGNFYASTIYSVATDNPAFTIAQGACSGVAVPVGSSCQLQVTFMPMAAQAYSGTATVVTYVSDSGQPFQKITLPLSGSSTNPPTATPVIAPGSGTYTSSQQVEITDATAGATIYYTTDGSAPSSASTKYGGAITVNSNETLTAIATAAGLSQSATAMATYTFQEPVATVSPTSLAFGNQVASQASMALTVTLKNTGIGALTIIGFPISGPGDFSQTNNCAGSLAAGGSCTVSVVFTPSSIGNTTATLTVNSNSIQAAPTVTLTGAGVVQPLVLAISPASLDFGNQVVNTDATLQTTVTNISKTDTILIGGVFTTSSIVLSAGSASCASPLAPGMSCTVYVAFSPTAIQALNGTVTLQPQPSGCGGCTRNYPAQTIAVTGASIAQPPVLAISPATLNFGNQVVNTSATLQTTVTNISKTDTILIGGIFTTSSITLSAGSANCSSPLAPGMSCTVYVAFSPTAIQALNGTVTLQPQPSGCGGCTRNYPAQTIAVTGASIAQPPVLAISPATLNFGNQVVGTSSATQSVTVTNSSKTDTVVISTYSISSGGFLFQPSNCLSPLAPGMSCAIPLIFTPQAIGTYSLSATIQLQPGACGGGCVVNYPAQTFTVTGTGTSIAEPPVFAFSPASLDFGGQIANIAATKTITVTNTSKTETVVFEAGSSSDGAFLVPEPNGCSFPMPPGGSCALNVTFLPAAARAYSGTLTFGVEDLGCNACTFPSQSYSVTGTGIVLAASLSPASFSFSTTMGTTSAPQTATLSNTGSAPLSIFSISIAGESPNDYRQTDNCPLLLDVGASCTISVTFTPASPGSYPANLTIADNDPASPQTTNLSGAGSVTPDFVIASATPAQFILPGSSAQFSLTVTAQNGATIPAVQLAATGLPPGATATFSHSAVTPGSTSATSTLTIKTSTTSAAVAGSAWPLATPALALAGLFFLPAKRRRRWAVLGVLMIVALGALTALSGCGGSAFPPAKSYTVTITGTIGAVQQTTTVQLTVQ